MPSSSASPSGPGVQREPAIVDSPVLVHPGCSQYCRTAGGYGDGDDRDVREAVKITVDDPVVPFDDDTIPVRFTCLTSLDCEGAVIVDLSNPDDADKYGSPEYGSSDGRCDLLVEAGGSEAFAVPLSQPILAALEDKAKVEVLIIADVYPTIERLPSVEADKYSGPDLSRTLVIMR
jgi:hypothetical protein